MARDWWWPWWISVVIDLGVATAAVAVVVRARRGTLRALAGLVACIALGAAALAPVVMKQPPRPAPSMKTHLNEEMSK